MQSTCHVVVPLYEMDRYDALHIYAPHCERGTIWFAVSSSPWAYYANASHCNAFKRFASVQNKKRFVFSCTFESMRMQILWLFQRFEVHCSRFEKPHFFPIHHLARLLARSRSVRLFLWWIKTFASMYVMIWARWCVVGMSVFFLCLHTLFQSKKDEISNVLLLDSGSETEVHGLWLSVCACIFSSELENEIGFIAIPLFIRHYRLLVRWLSPSLFHTVKLFVCCFLFHPSCECVPVSATHKTDPKEVKNVRKKII